MEKTQDTTGTPSISDSKDTFKTADENSKDTFKTADEISKDTFKTADEISADKISTGTLKTADEISTGTKTADDLNSNALKTADDLNTNALKIADEETKTSPNSDTIDEDINKNGLEPLNESQKNDEPIYTPQATETSSQKDNILHELKNFFIDKKLVCFDEYYKTQTINECLEYIEKIQELENKLKLIENSNDNQDKIEELEKELNDNKSKLNEKLIEIDNLKKQNNDNASKIQELQSDNSQKIEELEKEKLNLENQNNENIIKIQELENKLQNDNSDKIQEEKLNLENQNNKNIIKIQELEKEKSNLENQNNENTTKITQLQYELNEKLGTINNLEEKHKTSIDELNNKITKLSQNNESKIQELLKENENLKRTQVIKNTSYSKPVTFTTQNLNSTNKLFIYPGEYIYDNKGASQNNTNHIVLNKNHILIKSLNITNVNNILVDRVKYLNEEISLKLNDANKIKNIINDIIKKNNLKNTDKIDFLVKIYYENAQDPKPKIMYLNIPISYINNLVFKGGSSSLDWNKPILTSNEGNMLITKVIYFINELNKLDKNTNINNIITSLENIIKEVQHKNDKLLLWEILSLDEVNGQNIKELNNKTVKDILIKKIKERAELSGGSEIIILEKDEWDKTKNDSIFGKKLSNKDIYKIRVDDNDYYIKSQDNEGVILQKSCDIINEEIQKIINNINSYFNSPKIDSNFNQPEMDNNFNQPEMDSNFNQQEMDGGISNMNSNDTGKYFNSESQINEGETSTQKHSKDTNVQNKTDAFSAIGGNVELDTKMLNKITMIIYNIIFFSILVLCVITVIINILNVIKFITKCFEDIGKIHHNNLLTKDTFRYKLLSYIVFVNTCNIPSIFSSFNETNTTSDSLTKLSTVLDQFYGKDKNKDNILDILDNDKEKLVDIYYKDWEDTQNKEQITDDDKKQKMEEIKIMVNKELEIKNSNEKKNTEPLFNIFLNMRLNFMNIKLYLTFLMIVILTFILFIVISFVTASSNPETKVDLNIFGKQKLFNIQIQLALICFVYIVLNMIIYKYMFMKAYSIYLTTYVSIMHIDLEINKIKQMDNNNDIDTNYANLLYNNIDNTKLIETKVIDYINNSEKDDNFIIKNILIYVLIKHLYSSNKNIKDKIINYFYTTDNFKQNMADKEQILDNTDTYFSLLTNKNRNQLISYYKFTTIKNITNIERAENIRKEVNNKIAILNEKINIANSYFDYENFVINLGWYFIISLLLSAIFVGIIIYVVIQNTSNINDITELLNIS